MDRTQNAGAGPAACTSESPAAATPGSPGLTSQPHFTLVSGAANNNTTPAPRVTLSGREEKGTRVEQVSVPARSLHPHPPHPCSWLVLRLCGGYGKASIPAGKLLKSS